MLESVPSKVVQKYGEENGKDGEKNGEGNGERKRITADEHLMGRLRATYLGMYGNEGEREDGGKKE